MASDVERALHYDAISRADPELAHAREVVLDGDRARELPVFDAEDESQPTSSVARPF